MTRDRLPTWYRRAAVLLFLGLSVEALSLLELHSPTSFLSFAILGGTAIVAGVACFVRAVVVPREAASSMTSNPPKGV